jgi:hypothetical protein
MTAPAGPQATADDGPRVSCAPVQVADRPGGLRLRRPVPDLPGSSSTLVSPSSLRIETPPVPSRRPLNASLLHILRMVIRADSDPARRALFGSLVQSNWRVRLAFRVHDRLDGTWASTLLVSCYGLASFVSIAPPRNRTASILVVAKHANARRQVARVASWVGSSECEWIRSDARALLRPSALSALAGLAAHPRRLRASLRIVRAIDRQYGFLVGCRAAAALAWYARAGTILRAHRPAAVLVSSDSHPEEVGFVSAARALQIPQVFISHAYPTPLSPPLDFSLSILEGEAAVEARRQKGPIRGEVLLAGVEGDSASMDARRFHRPDPVVGLFPPKALSWDRLAAIVGECRQHFHARRIVIRWHPSMLAPPRLADVLTDLSDIVESPRDASLPEVAGQCDWVVADENSNVHLPVLKLGIPTVAIRGLGLYPPSRSDLYGFIANRIVFPPVRSVRDVDADALIAFFSDAWAVRFEHYDASYLRSGSEIGHDVRHAVLRLTTDTAAKSADV